MMTGQNSNGSRDEAGKPGDSPEDYKKARQKAMALLERSDRSCKELLDRLSQAGFSEEASRQALEYVASFGYVDDARYAQNYIRRHLRKKSPSQLTAELRQKGVSREIARQAWDEVAALEEYDENETLRRMVQEKCAGVIPKDPAAKRRLYAYFARRGFSYENIAHALSSLSEEE